MLPKHFPRFWVSAFLAYMRANQKQALKIIKSADQSKQFKSYLSTQNHEQNIKRPKIDIKLAVINKLLNDLVIFFQKINFHSKPYVQDFFWNF